MSSEQLQPDPLPRDEPWGAVRQRAQRARQHRAGLLVGDMVHDLRNPLAVIQGFTQLLLNSSRDQGDRRDLERILDETMRMSGLLDCVIEFLRAEPESPGEVSLDRVIEIACTLSHQLAQHHHVGVTVHPASSPAVVKAHVGPLVQVLLTGLELAVECAAPGGLVSVSCRGLEPGRVGLLITHGLEPALPDRAQESCSTFAAECAELPLCRQLLAGYGGSLRMTDQPLLIVLDLPGR